MLVAIVHCPCHVLQALEVVQEYCDKGLFRKANKRDAKAFAAAAAAAAAAEAKGRSGGGAGDGRPKYRNPLEGSCPVCRDIALGT